ncbi:MAG: ATP-binding protein [Marinifilaceae bacterium]|nr:ATP-binding protein [Marinifilaceae bacterium]
MKRLELKIASGVSQISEVEKFIDSFTTEFSLGQRLYGQIDLSIIEAVNNAILFGNKRDESKFVTIVATLDETIFYVSIEDEGEGFDYKNYPVDPTLPENIEKTSGRGIYLMSILSDKMIYEKGGSKVTLYFNL